MAVKKIPAAQNRRSLLLPEGGVNLSRSTRLSGGFSLVGGSVEVVQAMGFMTALVVLNVQDTNGHAISITMLPDDAERVADLLSGVAGAVEGR